MLKRNLTKFYFKVIYKIVQIFIDIKNMFKFI